MISLAMKNIIASLFFLVLFFCFDGKAEELDNNQFESSFKTGLVELNCGNLICAGRWGANRRDLKAYINNADWMLLAKRTSELNYQHILGYYYLAKSAFMLGYYDAAKEYIDKSQSSDVKKNCGLGVCEGLDMQIELARLENQIAQAKETQTKAKPQDTQQTFIKESANSNYVGGYVPQEVIYSGGGYVPDATTSKKTGISVKTETNKIKSDTDVGMISSEALCKSYGLKKGTRDYAECMLKIREQDIAKEKNIKDAALLEQKAIEYKKALDDKHQIELQAAEDEQRKKQATEESLRAKQIQTQQLQYGNAVRQCLMKAKMLYESTSDLVRTQIRNNDDRHLYFLMENMKYEASDKCRQNTGYADLMEKQIFSYTPQPATPAPNAVPNNLHCQTRAAGGQIYTDCY